jgi:predicted nucleotidyltransferase
VTPHELARRLADLPSAAGVTVALLHGSRARGDARPGSDWDIGVLAGESPNLPAVTADIAAILGTDMIDVVDLRTASALLRFRAARDGIALVERPSGAFEAFQLEAVQFWCDAGPVIRAAQEDVLAGLG